MPVQLGTFRLGTLRLGAGSGNVSNGFTTLPGVSSPSSLYGLDTPSVVLGQSSPSERTGGS